MSIQTNLEIIKSELPENVTLVAVSKTKPVSDLLEAYQAGQRIFGENKVQEMVDKWSQMPKDVEWHMIGHLQRNKVKYIAEFVSLIHGVDSLKLLQEIEKQGAKHNRTIECLLQMHIAEEDTKFGMNKEELTQLLDSDEFKNMKFVKVTGLMGMATFTDNETQISKEFNSLKTIFDYYRPKQTPNCEFKNLSMGMSGDYKTAIHCGSTMVRIGSSIFGSRSYQE